MVSRIALATAVVVGLSFAQSPKEAIADSGASCISCLPKSFWDSVKKKVGSAYHATVDATKSVWNKGLDHVKAQASEMWAGIKSLDCGRIVDGLSGMDPMTILLDKLWKPSGVCLREFRKGAICAIPDVIRDLVILAKNTIVAGWEHRSVCIPASIAMPGGFPLCGFYYFAKEQIGKMAKCFKAMSRDQIFSMLWAEFWRLGCYIAGEILMDVILEALSLGTGTVAIVAQWVNKVGKLLSPSRWMGIDKYLKLKKVGERVVGRVSRGVEFAVYYSRNMAVSLAECAGDSDKGSPDVVTQVKQLAKEKAAIVKKWGQDGWRLVEKTGRKGYEALKKYGREAVVAFKRFGEKVVENAKYYVAEAKKAIKKGVETVKETAKKAVDTAAAAKKAVTDTAAAAKKKAEEVAAAAAKVAEQAAAAARAAFNMAGYGACLVKCCLYSPLQCSNQKTPTDFNACTATCDKTYNYSSAIAFNKGRYLGCVTKCCIDSPLQCSGVRSSASDFDPCVKACK